MGQKNFFLQFLHTTKSYYGLAGTCHSNRQANIINKFLIKSILNIVGLEFDTFITPKLHFRIFRTIQRKFCWCKSTMRSVCTCRRCLFQRLLYFTSSHCTGTMILVHDKKIQQTSNITEYLCHHNFHCMSNFHSVNMS